MADKTIGDLTQAESIGGEDLFVLQQNGEAKKLKGARLVKYAQDTVSAQVMAATEAAESAETAKTGAESAQTQAQAARDAILNMIVEAITLESGTAATVEKSLVDSVYKLTFGLPKGDKGNPGAGDMTQAVYDPQGKTQDIFAYADAKYSADNPPPYPVTSVNGQTGAVTVQSGSEAASYTATLLSNGWAADGGYQKQTVTVTGLKASYPVAPVVDAQLSGMDADGDAAILTAFAAVNILQTAENQLIAYCIGAAPTTNIPLIINTWG